LNLEQDDPEEIGPEGIERFCYDLNIGLESVSNNNNINLSFNNYK